MRQVIAELVQIPGSQRLVINSDRTGLRCWLPLATDWSLAVHRRPFLT